MMLKPFILALFFAFAATSQQQSSPQVDPHRLERIEIYMRTHDPMAEEKIMHRRDAQICQEALSNSLAAVNALTTYRQAVIHNQSPDLKRFRKALTQQIRSDKLAKQFCQ